MTEKYDLDALRAAAWVNLPSAYECDMQDDEAMDRLVKAVLGASGLLDDAALGRAVPALVDMLKECARQFRFYAEQHKAKGTPEADEKARVNTDFAVRIANLLHSDQARTAGIERAAHLIALGLRVEAAAERDGPEREAMAEAIFDANIAETDEAQAAARALVAMKEQAK